MTIQELMCGIDYIAEKAFPNSFKKHTGLSPVGYRNKYNNEMAFAC